ncbi:glycoside hydrolase family 43 protein [Zasmidium cellare ATCC 36951]|uniref:Glycoside hydrolase family 43 protein n=1 Tax=Zasmidium cellare ATCC 36951 TaxID=1080233 RepID=A0A6A6C0G1_ZASCE|nr:glycoside hydrolase family 43 protein [Zasmidium cellare ATCC 36951]KAF2160537.1 glycoside hydrolase family 43 protein [Zasmidium cellare ATCC 36951]
MTPFSTLVALLATLAHAADYYNPIRNDSADPFMVYDQGNWYLLSTGGDVGITSAPTVAQLANAERVPVFSSTNTSYDVDYWPPEVHNFDGTWYIFTTAASSTAQDRDASRRIHVLKGGSTPAGPYTYAAQLGANVAGDQWAIDPTVLFDGGNHYLVWSCHDEAAYNAQSICIGQLNGPTELLNRVVISTPTNGWEQNGFPVNEGPSAVYYNGRTFLSFSASYCGTAQYSLGILAYNGNGILNPSSWNKTGPLFTSANGDYGPGHNGFVLNPGTTQDWWQVYHATPKSSGGCDNSRNTFFQKVNFDSNNFPVFGQPEAVGGPYAGPPGE